MMFMRRRLCMKLIICVIVLGSGVIIHWAYREGLTQSEWFGLVAILLTAGAYMISLVTLFPFFRKMREDELKHTSDLIRNVFDTPMTPASVVYELDEIVYTPAHWKKTSETFDFAMKHMRHKKYKTMNQAYKNIKHNDDAAIVKIDETIIQYRIMVCLRVNIDRFSLTDVGDRRVTKSGEYSKKRLNHVIFHDVWGTNATTSAKKLVMFPAGNDICRLDWCDAIPFNNGAVGGDTIAIGDRAAMECLKDGIMWLENETDVVETVREIAGIMH